MAHKYSIPQIRVHTGHRLCVKGKFRRHEYMSAAQFESRVLYLQVPESQNLPCRGLIYRLNLPSVCTKVGSSKKRPTMIGHCAKMTIHCLVTAHSTRRLLASRYSSLASSSGRFEIMLRPDFAPNIACRTLLICWKLLCIALTESWEYVHRAQSGRTCETVSRFLCCVTRCVLP